MCVCGCTIEIGSVCKGSGREKESVQRLKERERDGKCVQREGRIVF